MRAVVQCVSEASVTVEGGRLVLSERATPSLLGWGMATPG